MELSDYIAVRWGEPVGYDLSGDELRKVWKRNSSLWQSLRRVVAFETSEPKVEGVHSARALPALIHFNGESVIVWDAGLGTLLSSFAFMLPYPQPLPVAKALVHRVCAVRLTSAGQQANADLHARKATELLEENPFDRRHQYGADAESQFEVWLTTELQERFVLAHEQIHYLHRTDQRSFNELQSLLLHTLANLESLRLDDYSPLQSSGPEVPENMTWMSLLDRHVDYYSWYLKTWTEGTASVTGPAEWKSRHSRVRDALTRSNILLEESVCDVFGALAVCIDSHSRQRGWDANMAAACSRLALESLGMIVGIDSTLSIGSKAPNASPADIAIRGECLEIVLPGLLLQLLREFAALDDTELNTVPSQSDLREIMRLAGERASALYSPAFDAVDGLPLGAADHSFTVSEKILADSGFLHLRPSPDYRTSWLFGLGVVETSANVLALLQQEPEMGPELDFLIQRHQRGDWGDIPEEDAQANRHALWREFANVNPEDARNHRGAIWSFYMYGTNRLLVVTDADRQRTIIFTPAEL
jgi:hypothetical protein